MSRRYFKKDEVIGKLTIIERQIRTLSSGRAYYGFLCSCACGEVTWVAQTSLKQGATVSCGCHRDTTRMTHNEHRHPVYRVWADMKSRCDNPKLRCFSWYGGRGISYALAWAEYEAFAAWAKQAGYAKGLQLDRKDNDGDYTPDNCRFVHCVTNIHNQRLLSSSNRSGYRGVFCRKGTFYVTVECWGRKFRRAFKLLTAEEAAKWRDAYCIIHKFPLPLNFPEMTDEEAKQIIEESNNGSKAT